MEPTHTKDFHNMEHHSHSHPFPLLTVIMILAVLVFGISYLRGVIDTKKQQNALEQIKDQASSQLVGDKEAHFEATEEQKAEATNRLID